MSDELNPAIVKRTQNTLGKFVKKPSLTEKLLKKPPFRFLHDVFRVIIRDTGCFEGLYTSEELTFENIRDREDKMKFLQKMIDVVKLTTGSSLAVKTSKIVAGHETEKTNELLQLMGEIIENKLDWQTAVEHVRAGETTHKESLRKPKDTLNKVAKESKSKDNIKEKESRTKDPKTTKTPANKITIATNKNDKTKNKKAQDTTTRKLITKEKNLKGSTKELDKSDKKPGSDASNLKPKLIKTASHISNKSSPPPNTQTTDKELISPQKEPKEIEAQMRTPAKKMSNNNANNEILNTNEASIHNENNTPPLSNLEVENLSAEKSKESSAKFRTFSASIPAEGFGDRVDDKEHGLHMEMDKSIMPAQEKSEISEIETTASLKQESANYEQQQIQKHSPPLQKSPAASLPNEMKRESTFTRENSRQSIKSSSATRPRTSLRPPSARPPSARPGAPRRRDKNIEIILQPNDKIKMSGIEVKLETFGDLDDDGENLVIIENPSASDVAIVQQSNLTESEKVTQDETFEQGHLVQQILETQKELVQHKTNANSQQKNDKDSSNNSVMRQTSARNMNNLRDVIQNLTRSVNPLGKLMDFIPEDIDAMQLEFTLWRDNYTQAANELKREKSLTESATEPLKNQLAQIEANIGEYMEMINASRVKILQNSEKIINMLTTS